MLRVALICLVLALPGCASLFDAPKPVAVRTTSTVEVTLTDNLPPDMNGYAIVEDGYCRVYLRLSTYPRCIRHEFRHCMEDDFHSYTNYSSEDCGENK